MRMSREAVMFFTDRSIEDWSGRLAAVGNAIESFSSRFCEIGPAIQMLAAQMRRSLEVRQLTRKLRMLTNRLLSGRSI